MIDAKITTLADSNNLSIDQKSLVRLWVKKHLPTLERHGWSFTLYADPQAFLENIMALSIGIYIGKITRRPGDGLVEYLLRVKDHEDSRKEADNKRFFPVMMWPDRVRNDN